MSRTKKKSRLAMTLVTVGLVGAALAGAFWPRAILVDMAPVRLGSMRVTINEEGRTQVREPYVVSSPVAGELQRVTVVPGEQVTKGETIVAQMRPANPSALDVRTREQAMAAVTAAEAALRVARADLNAASANRDFSHSELGRVQQLVDRGITSKVALERAEQQTRVADANVDTVEAAIAMREAELQNTRARLISFDDSGVDGLLGIEDTRSPSIPLRAPIDGTILKIIHKSETTLPAGEPILEIGDIEGDLEVVADLLSSDAVQVVTGNRVVITNWGGTSDLGGVVTRIDPYGFTKYSALGVEEQRVETIIRFDETNNGYGNLGHGYRVEVRIVVWEKDQVLIVPSSALFRQNRDWAVFAVRDGRAVLRRIQIGQNNGIEAELLDGLNPGDQVILFPSANLSDGKKVAQREVN